MRKGSSLHQIASLMPRTVARPVEGGRREDVALDASSDDIARFEVPGSFYNAQFSDDCNSGLSNTKMQIFLIKLFLNNNRRR